MAIGAYNVGRAYVDSRRELRHLTTAKLKEKLVEEYAAEMGPEELREHIKSVLDL